MIDEFREHLKTLETLF